MGKIIDSNEVEKLVTLFKRKECGVELVRIGGENDGGYLVPDDFEGIEYCFSPGVDTTASFEEACLNKGIRSFLADYSVDAAPIALKECIFTKKYLGSINDDKTITMDDWITESLPEGYNTDLILQMDIEGAEYEVILSTSDINIKRFRIIIIEFHNLASFQDKNYFNIVNSAMKKITNNFVPVHIHPNNCCGHQNINGVKFPKVFEVTFLRKDRVKKYGDINQLPHELDQPNIPYKKDIVMPSNWF